MLTTLVLLILTIYQPTEKICGNREDMYPAFNQVMELSDPALVTSGLEGLKRNWEDCGIEKDSVYAKILHSLGRIYWKQGDNDRGIALTLTAIEINSAPLPLAAPKELCNSFFNLGAMYAQKGAIKECLDAYAQSIRYGVEHPEKLFIVAMAYKESASAHFGEGDLEKAIFTGEKGFEVARKISHTGYMTENLIEKTQALIQLGKLEEARQTLERIDALNSVNPIHQAAVHALYAELNVRLSRFDLAIAAHEKSFASFLKGGFDYGCGQASVNLGYLYADRLGNPEMAIRYYERAINYFSENQDKAVVLNSIAHAKNKMGRTDEALATSQRALNTFLPDFKNTDWQTNPRASTIREVIDKTNLLSLVTEKGNILHQLHQTTGDRQTLELALATYMLADTMVDYMRWEHSGALSKLFWRDNTRTLYENAIETCYTLGAPEKAFYFFEKSRSALLNDQLNELAAARQLSPEDQKKENKLKRNVKRIQEQMGAEVSGEVERSRLKDMLSHAQNELQIFIKHLEMANPAYYAYKYNNHVTDLVVFRQETLDSGQTFLTYFVGEKALYGLTCDASGTVLKKIKLSDFQEAVRDVKNYLSDKVNQNRDFAGYLSASHRLYRLMIEPFDLPEHQRLIISPGGELLPFAALSRSADREEFLIRTNPIGYTYSAGYLARSHRKKRPWYSLNSFFGMAPVDFSPRLEQASLPGSDKALRELDKHFLFSTLLEKKNATKGGFTKNISRYPIVQLFTHAEASDTPVLYFADSVLTLNQLDMPYRNNTDLLILSACETGVGIDQPGEGVFSLARGFAGLDVPSVVTTLWKMESGSVYEITRLFYKGLVRGISLDVALQKAQLKWLDSAEKSDRLPYVWAGKVVIGNSEPVPTGVSPFLIWIAVFSALIVFGVYYVKNKIPHHKVVSKK